MNISFENHDDQVTFRLSDFDPKYEDVFKMCFYQQDGASYIKRFASATPRLAAIQEYYRQHAEEMFSQLGYFAPIPWENALREFAQRIDGSGIDWWLTGSCAACIRGIPFNPHDVDIMVNGRDVEQIRDLFADVTIEPIIDTNGWLTKDFGVLFLHARIDIASDPHPSLDDPEPVDCGPYAKEHLETVIWNGCAIRVPPLRLQHYVNLKRGRTERANLIEKHLRDRES